jgi:hypothetical protein
MVYGFGYYLYYVDVFQRFRDITNDTSEVFSHEWRDDMNMGAETLSMRVGGITMVMHCRLQPGASYVPVTQSRFLEIQHSMMQQCSEALGRLFRSLTSVSQLLS